MSDIPRARDRLLALAGELSSRDRATAEEIRRIVREDLIREPPIRKAARAKAPVDADKAAEIRDYARRHPMKHLQDIATAFGTNAGRVSEALNRKR